MAPISPPSPDDWLTRKEAAHYITSRGRRISATTLDRLAMNNNSGRGPPFTRFSWAQVKYRRGDLDDWIARNLKRIR